jgi:ubiquinone/menaquinone biosynthesis C-methylase UbiE
MNTKICQLCNSKKLKKVIDLGHHPLADSFLPEALIHEKQTMYPLNVVLCADCGHAMLGYIVPAEERYQAVPYSYTGGNSPVSVKHFGEMAETISKEFGVKKGDIVVDVGSNDGTLLKAFKTVSGAEILGVEPSNNIFKIALKNKIPTLNQFFDESAVKKILKKGKVKVITATNVFNHLTSIQAFMKEVKKILRPDAVLVIEVPYFLDLLQKGAFDTIYLEHISYFNVKSFEVFFKKYGFSILKLEKNEYQGGSIRVYIGKGKPTPDVKKYGKDEVSYGVYMLSTYVDFMKRIEDFRFTLCEQIYEAKAKHKKIIAIGAATKGNTLLNYCKIDRMLIDFVTDSSALKIGKYMPGSLIPIKNDTDITKEIEYALILPWNIADFLVKKLSHLGLRFIIPSMK